MVWRACGLPRLSDWSLAVGKKVNVWFGPTGVPQRLEVADDTTKETMEMRSWTSEIITNLLKAPEVAEQLRKFLVNRDISLTIDGNTYQITRKAEERDEIKELKSELWDMRKLLISIAKLKTEDKEVLSLVNKAKELLGK